MATDVKNPTFKEKRSLRGVVILLNGRGCHSLNVCTKPSVDHQSWTEVGDAVGSNLRGPALRLIQLMYTWIFQRFPATVHVFVESQRFQATHVCCAQSQRF